VKSSFQKTYLVVLESNFAPLIGVWSGYKMGKFIYEIWVGLYVGHRIFPFRWFET